jgi:hypothetical protein
MSVVFFYFVVARVWIVTSPEKNEWKWIYIRDEEELVLTLRTAIFKI